MATKYGSSTNETIKHLVEYLKHSLDDSFEIFVEPKINGDHLHIVIIRKNAGIYLLQVKPTILDNYHLDENWVEKDSLKQFQSPIQQMVNYKNNFYSYHIPGIYERLVDDGQMYGMIRCGLYFEKATTTYATSYLKKDKNFSKYIDVFGYNCIDRGQIVNVILKRLSYPKHQLLFTEDLYLAIKEILLNKKNVTQELNKIENNKAQSIIQSTKNKLKIRSASPELLYTTLVRKITNAPKRTLVLTFSMTLASYIRSIIPKEISHRVLVIHVHQFLTAQQNNFNILSSIESEQFWNDMKHNEKHFNRYETIIFTEVDKYSHNFQKRINDYFLKPNGNVYYFQHDDGEQKLKSTISGKWLRLDGKQKIEKNIHHQYKNNQLIDVFDLKEFLREKEFTWEQTVILCSQKSYLRFIEEQLRGKLGIFADITFATTTEWEKLKKKISNTTFGLEIQKLERNKKIHFGSDQNKMQLNTINSHSSFYKRLIICIVTDKDREDSFQKIVDSNDKFPTDILYVYLGRFETIVK